MRYRLILVFCVFSIGSGFSQVVYERHNNEVYNFLSRFAQKGVIIFDDLIRPVSKQKIHTALDSIAAHPQLLSELEKKELAFYLEEYTEGTRKRILRANSTDFSIEADPIVTASYLSGSGKDIKTTSMGINLWGHAGKKWGFQFSFHDVNLNGTGLDTSYKGFEAGSATGPILINNYKTNSQNFIEIRGHLSYEFKNGSISAGQDYLLWGYGENRIVLSDKAPTYPYLRLDYSPLPWLRFNYTHAWLQSGLTDSLRSYTIPSGMSGGVREVDIAKFMASHSLDFTIRKGLNFTLGESVIYNDRLNIGFLIPVMFFKAIDNNNGAAGLQKGSNGQFFFQLNSRNQLRKTHLYGTLFIDEIRLSEIFSKEKQRNQLGYTLGGSVTDIAGISYLTAGIEYTRIRPFVYRNILPAQNYTHAGYLLGDWMGNNADRLTGFVKYTPLPKLKLQMRYSHIRKGGPGTLNQQYVQSTQPPFLFDFQRKADELFFTASYEYLHRLCINGYFRKFDKDQSIFIGMSYGL
ncbi:MAG: capsule assembly Wzi family protein [Bacteroidota bacterium]